MTTGKHRRKGSPVLMLGTAVFMAAATGLYSAQTLAQAQQEGRKLFEQHCALCHRAGGTGTYMLERRYSAEDALLEQRPLPGDYVRQVVRYGLGSMPRFTRAEVSTPELDAIAVYLEQAGR